VGSRFEGIAAVGSRCGGRRKVGLRQAPSVAAKTLFLRWETRVPSSSNPVRGGVGAGAGS